MTPRSTTPDVPPMARLAAIASGLAQSLALEPYELAGEGARSYARLLSTDLYEAWLIVWSHAADLELHDHGGSIGAFHVASGSLVEEYTDLDTVAPLQTLALEPGTTREVPLLRVHRVFNPGPATAVSVHVYSPPLRSMTFYETSRGLLAPARTELVGEDSPEPLAVPGQ
ncbi:MAG: cysteine dioxygenase [Actinomycetota bacterium]